MNLLSKLTTEASKTPAGAFSKQHLGLYLFGRIPDDHALAFATRVGAPSAVDLIKSLRSGAPRSNGTFLLRVEKSDRNAWRSRISVGRAGNNDLVLRHASVSKLHAHFLVRSITRNGQAGEELVLCDVGSANGTLVNGVSLAEGEDQAVVLTVGARILFGEVQCELYDASILHAKLRRLAALSDF
jgi:hypothetical protein